MIAALPLYAAIAFIYCRFMLLDADYALMIFSYAMMLYFSSDDAMMRYAIYDAAIIFMPRYC